MCSHFQAVPAREALPGVFGLISAWGKDDRFARRTYNARSETAATLPSFCDAWRRGQKCTIPAGVVILPEAPYDDWLTARADQSLTFMRHYPAEQLVTSF